MNRNRNRFAEPTSVQIGIGIVCESKNLQIGIGIIFVKWELFVNYSQISEIFFLSYIIRQIKILANRNNIHEMKLWRIGIGIYS